jgi:cytochrome c-type biogenesis protein CcmH
MPRRFEMRRSLAVALALVALLLAAHGSAQAEAEPEGWAYRYFGETMSPFCPGRTLSACTSPQADSLRMWVLVQEAAGRSEEDVHSELVERYGDIILSAPRAEGFGIAAYAVPALAFLAGGLLVVVFLRRQTRAAAESPPPSPTGPVDPELERIIDEELAR